MSFRNVLNNQTNMTSAGVSRTVKKEENVEQSMIDMMQEFKNRFRLSKEEFSEKRELSFYETSKLLDALDVLNKHEKVYEKIDFSSLNQDVEVDDLDINRVFEVSVRDVLDKEISILGLTDRNGEWNANRYHELRNGNRQTLSENDNFLLEKIRDINRYMGLQDGSEPKTRMIQSPKQIVDDLFYRDMLDNVISVDGKEPRTLSIPIDYINHYEWQKNRTYEPVVHSYEDSKRLLDAFDTIGVTGLYGKNELNSEFKEVDGFDDYGVSIDLLYSKAYGQLPSMKELEGKERSDLSEKDQALIKAVEVINEYNNEQLLHPTDKFAQSLARDYLPKVFGEKIPSQVRSEAEYLQMKDMHLDEESRMFMIPKSDVMRYQGEHAYLKSMEDRKVNQRKIDRSLQVSELASVIEEGYAGRSGFGE